MRKIFFDEQLNKEFSTNGFVKIKFLQNEDIDLLKEFYINNFFNVDYHIDKEGFNREYAEFSVIDFTKESRIKCFEYINSIFERTVSSILFNYKPVIGNFISKYPLKGKLPIHQNWSLVDENNYTSISVWCPLQDTNSHNGTLKVLKGSHNFFRGFRKAESHERFINLSNNFINKYFEDIDVKIGEAIILDDALLHGSNINYSNEIRISVQQILIPNEIQEPFFCFTSSSENNETFVYQVDKEFFFQLKDLRGDVSKFRLFKKIDFDNTPVSEYMLESLTNSMPKYD